jgi:hypothetical protein
MALHDQVDRLSFTMMGKGFRARSGQRPLVAEDQMLQDVGGRYSGKIAAASCGGK